MTDSEKIQSNLKQIERNLDEAERNIRITIWMWKYLLIPMWVFIIVLKIVRHFK